jgi:hypothetical protein
MSMVEYGLLLVVLLNLLVVLLFMKVVVNKPRNVEKPVVAPKNNFEQDVQYLMFLVDYFCNQARNVKLIPFQKANASENFINDETLHSVIFETTREIMICLSEPYRNSLGAYMDNVTDFVSTLVFNRLTEEAMALNKQVIKKLNRL